MVAAPQGPIPLVVVARWFPAHDQPGRGAFVVHQIDALRASGRVAPSVVTFEDVRLAGTSERQLAEAELVIRQVARTAGDPRSISRQGVNGPPGVPVLRIRVPHFGANIRAADSAAIWHGRAATAAAGEWPGADANPAGVVHAHEPYPDGIAAAAIADACGWPLILTEHASYIEELLTQPEMRARYLAVAQRADRLVVVSRTLADRVLALAPELEPRITIIPNAIPTERFGAADRGARRREQLLYVGARRVEKGTDRLLDAFAAARRARPELTLRLIGTAPLGDEAWEARARELGVRDAVSFEPAATPDAVAAAMREAGVFVHPSPSETFGVVAAEALATGLPVAATASGGVTEIVGRGLGPLGETVEWDGADSLAGAILRTLDRWDAFDPDALRRSVVERFDAAAVAGQLDQMYLEARAGHDYRGGARIPPSPVAAASGAGTRAIVLGLNAPRLAERLRGFPVPLDLVVGTDPAPGDAGLPLGATIHAVDPGRWSREHRDRTGRSRPARIAERLTHGGRERSTGIHARLARTAMIADVAGIGAQLGAGWIVPLEGADAELAESASARGQLKVAPGGPRWLADQLVPG
jgi:glycosyltransferase involved in cell wall biosynthesis